MVRRNVRGYDRSVGSVAVEISPGHASLDHDNHCHIHNTQDAVGERRVRATLTHPTLLTPHLAVLVN